MTSDSIRRRGELILETRVGRCSQRQEIECLTIEKGSIKAGEQERTLLHTEQGTRLIDCVQDVGKAFNNELVFWLQEVRSEATCAIQETVKSLRLPPF
eukprot:m.43836 g.43836  ORF g.43836 m.43836 type:complete len:98 (+) comp12963_c0_seq1:629-922(+)